MEFDRGASYASFSTKMSHGSSLAQPKTKMHPLYPAPPKPQPPHQNLTPALPTSLEITYQISTASELVGMYSTNTSSITPLAPTHPARQPPLRSRASVSPHKHLPSLFKVVDGAVVKGSGTILPSWSTPNLVLAQAEHILMMVASFSPSISG